MLHGFVDAASDELIGDEPKDEFGIVKRIINSHKGFGPDVKDALKVLQDARGVPADYPVLASFEGLAQGKAFVSLAEAELKKNEKGLEEMEKVNNLREQLPLLKEHHRHALHSEAAVTLISNAFTEYDRLLALDLPNTSSTLQSTKEPFDRAAKTACKHHLTLELAPWLELQTGILKGNKRISALPEWPIFKLKEQVSKLIPCLVFKSYLRVWKIRSLCSCP